MSINIKKNIVRIGIIGFLFLSIIGINLLSHPVSATVTDDYWVGGTGDWTDVANHWASSSGGTAGTGVIPSATVNVHFDGNSDVGSNFTVTIPNMNAYCNNMDWSSTDVTPSLSLTFNTILYIYGSLAEKTGMLIYGTATWGNSIDFASTSMGNTINTYGVAQGVYWQFTGSGGGWTLASNVTINGTNGNSNYEFNCTAGTFDTGGYNITVNVPVGYSYGIYPNGFSITSPSMVNLNNSLITINDNSTYSTFWNCSGTLNAGTSAIVCNGNATGQPTSFAGGGATYSAVTFSGGTTGIGTIITGANTFTNLTKIGENNIGDYLSFSANQVINGVLTLTGYNSSTERLSIISSSVGTQRQMTVNGTVAITNCNIRDSAAVGSASKDISAGLNSDMGGNLGWIFTVPQNDYWVGNSGNWSDITHWASTSGGTGGTGRIPLIQDTAVFDTNSFSIPGRTVTIDVTNLGGVNTSTVANNPTLSSSAEVDIYGEVNFGTCIWTNTSGGTWFEGQNTIPIVAATGATYTFTSDIYISTNATYMTSVNFNSNFAIVGTIYLRSGTLCLQGFNVTAKKFDSSTTTKTRALNLSTGTLTLNDTTAVTKFNVASSNLSVYCGTSTIVLTNSGSTGQSFTGAGQTYYNLTIVGAGSYTMTFNDGNTFNQIYIDRSVTAKSIAGNFTETVGGLFSPSNGTVTVSIANTDFSKSSGTVVLDWLNFTSGDNTCVASGGATWYAGINSIGSPQTGWNFSSPAAPTVSTVSYTNVLSTSATLNGNVVSIGGYGTVYGYFEYGTDPTFTTYSTTSPTTPETGTGTFSFTVSGLASATTYYFEAVVGDGTAPLANGIVLSFIPGSATITTLAANPIGTSTATLNGNLSNLGSYSYAVVYFNWGTTPSYGNATPTQSFSVASSFNAMLGATTPLVAGVTYHFQAVGIITNNAGTQTTVTGGDMSFATQAEQYIPVTSQPYAPTGGSGSNGNSNTVPTLQQPTTWWANGGSMTSLPFYADFNSAADGMNPDNETTGEPTTMVLYLMAIMATAMAAGYGVILFTGSSLLALGVITITMGVGASMTIISGWMVFLILIGGGGLWMLAKYI